MRTTLFALLLLIGFSVAANEDHYTEDLKLEIQGKIVDSEGRALNAVTVTIFQDNDTTKYTTTSNGKFSLTITPNKDQAVITVSLDGYIQKSISFDFSKNQDQWENETVNTDMSLSLTKKKDGVDYSKVETDFYLGKYYISENGTLELDRHHMAKQKLILDQFLLLHHKE